MDCCCTNIFVIVFIEELPEKSYLIIPIMYFYVYACIPTQGVVLGPL